MAANAQIESDEVAAVNVRRTGESETRVKKTIIDDLRVFRSVKGRRFNLGSDRDDGGRERLGTYGCSLSVCCYRHVFRGPKGSRPCSK